MSSSASPAWDGNATLWRGRSSYQLPADLVRLQQVIWERRPEIIVETGAGGGGTTLFLADVCEAIGHGRVIGIEEQEVEPPSHPRIEWRHEHAAGTTADLLILDDDVYNERHCWKELEASRDSKFIVACHANRQDWGMASAVAAFLKHFSEFRVAFMPADSLHAWLIRR